MSEQYPFPTLPKSKLTRDDVVNYLLEQKHRGYDVFQDPGNSCILILVLDDAHRINFNMSDACQVQGCILNSIFMHFNVTTTIELRKAVDTIAQRAVGARWANSPRAGRVNENAPATNFVTISNLIGNSSIEAVFDPYLENRSLATLIDILSFGSGSVLTGVRVLSTNKTTGGQVPRLTKAGFDAWITQLGISGEIRIMGPSEHRRFLLLSGSQSLILGQSLNSIHKNEAVRIEPDGHDKTFFDQVWAQAKPLT